MISDELNCVVWIGKMQLLFPSSTKLVEIEARALNFVLPRQFCLWPEFKWNSERNFSSSKLLRMNSVSSGNLDQILESRQKLKS